MASTPVRMEELALHDSLMDHINAHVDLVLQEHSAKLTVG